MSYWEGYLGTLYENFSEEEINQVNPKIAAINKKLEVIFTLQTLKEVKRYCRNLLTDEERNYINSPVFDILMQSINEQDPLFHAVKRGGNKICKFYLSLDATNFCDLTEALILAKERKNFDLVNLIETYRNVNEMLES